MLVDFNKSLQGRTQNEDNPEQVATISIVKIMIIEDSLITYPNHTRAELPSAFRVSSQESSKPTGSIVMEQIPITAMMTNKAAVLFGLTKRSSINLLDFG